MAASNLNLGKASGGVLNIQPADGTTNTSLVLPASGTVTTNEYVNSSNLGNGSTTFNGFGGTGFKNYIINGSFDIDQYQRGTQSNWNSASCYIDRFFVFSSSSVVRNGAGANNPIGTGLCNHLSLTKTAEADTQIMQRWEIPKDKAKQFLNGRTLTFSCWVLSATANFVENLFFIKNGTSANSYEIKAFNITKNNVANTWTRVTGTITNIQWTYEAGEYIEIRLDPANWLAGELHTTGWQLEEGSIATPFENRPYGLEFSLCQRFARKIDFLEHYRAVAIGAHDIYFYIPTGYMRESGSAIFGTEGTDWVVISLGLIGNSGFSNPAIISFYGNGVLLKFTKIGHGLSDAVLKILTDKNLLVSTL